MEIEVWLKDRSFPVTFTSKKTGYCSTNFIYWVADDGKEYTFAIHSVRYFTETKDGN